MNFITEDYISGRRLCLVLTLDYSMMDGRRGGRPDSEQIKNVHSNFPTLWNNITTLFCERGIDSDVARGVGHLKLFISFIFGFGRKFIYK